MARQLWLLRHGEAVQEAPTDFQRPLTPRGESQSRTAGAALAALGIEFELVFSSPKLRALQTAPLACEVLGIEAPVVHQALSEGFHRDDALELLVAAADGAKVLVVGHEPDFSQVVYDLGGGRVDFKKGGIAALRVDGLRGELLVLLRPRELERIAAVVPTG